MDCLGAIYATCRILRFSENLQKALVKQGFEHLHQVARKKQTRGRRRPNTKSPGAPSKTLGKTWFWHMATQADAVGCLGAIHATCEILWFSGNLENHWKIQRFEHLHQVARKKQTRGRQRPTTESSGGPLKTIGKTRFWHTNRKYPFTANWPWQEKNNHKFGAFTPADTIT